MTSLHRSALLSAAALVVLAGSGCDALSLGDGDPQAATPAVVDNGTATGTGLSTLQFVAKSAMPCAQVWLSGARLPRDYEWCSDDSGEPVAGVREGSCEVIVHDGTMWAVPGGPIHVTGAEVSRDRGYVEATTSCKRRPVARDQR